MVRTIFKAKTAQVNRAATLASASAASAYGRDLDDWPHSWMGLEKDVPPGEGLVVASGPSSSIWPPRVFPRKPFAGTWTISGCWVEKSSRSELHPCPKKGPCRETYS